MNTHTRQDEITLWQMYMFSGVQAIQEAPEAEGITIVQAASGREYRYHFCTDQVSAFADMLTGNGDTQILYLVHVWKNHTLDVPSYDLRKALLDLHPENKDALMLLTGAENFIVRSIQSTMP